ncbi:hypothetical protein MMC30_003000 [Trapelia coarctata]|nr:hypothetical protein [Trapelia coarctata]
MVNQEQLRACGPNTVQPSARGLASLAQKRQLLFTTPTRTAKLITALKLKTKAMSENHPLSRIVRKWWSFQRNGTDAAMPLGVMETLEKATDAQSIELRQSLRD